MLGGRSMRALLFTSIRRNPVKPPNESGKLPRALLLKSRTCRAVIVPMVSGKNAMELFSRFKYVICEQSAMFAWTDCMRFPLRSKSVTFFPRSPTKAPTSRSKHPPMFSEVSRFSFVNTTGIVSNLLYVSFTLRRCRSVASSGGRSVRSLERKSSSTRLGIFPTISRTRDVSRQGRSMYEMFSLPSRAASARRFAHNSSVSLDIGAGTARTGGRMFPIWARAQINHRTNEPQNNHQTTRSSLAPPQRERPAPPPVPVSPFSTSARPRVPVLSGSCARARGEPPCSCARFLNETKPNNGPKLVRSIISAYGLIRGNQRVNNSPRKPLSLPFRASRIGS